MGDICIIQLTYCRVNRSGVYYALKSNVDHASPIYAVCEWDLCIPFSIQTAWRFVPQPELLFATTVERCS